MDFDFRFILLSFCGADPNGVRAWRTFRKSVIDFLLFLGGDFFMTDPVAFLGTLPDLRWKSPIEFSTGNSSRIYLRDELIVPPDTSSSLPLTMLRLLVGLNFRTFSASLFS